MDFIHSHFHFKNFINYLLTDATTLENRRWGGSAVHATASDLYTAATLETDTIIQDGWKIIFQWASIHQRST